MILFYSVSDIKANNCWLLNRECAMGVENSLKFTQVEMTIFNAKLAYCWLSEISGLTYVSLHGIIIYSSAHIVNANRKGK